jgi:hypothetical protein
MYDYKKKKWQRQKELTKEIFYYDRKEMGKTKRKKRK